jgi:hypothetical protein
MVKIRLEMDEQSFELSDSSLDDLTSWPTVMRLFFQVLAGAGYHLGIDSDKAIEALVDMSIITDKDFG